jgi:hypothetical protein
MAAEWVRNEAARACLIVRYEVAGDQSQLLVTQRVN